MTAGTLPLLLSLLLMVVAADTLMVMRRRKWGASVVFERARQKPAEGPRVSADEFTWPEYVVVSGF